MVNNTIIYEFMNRIGMPKESIQVVLNYEMTDEIYNNWKQLFYENSKQFFEELDVVQKKEALTLYLYVRLAIEGKNRFLEKGINEVVYYDTMRDLAVWCYDCMKKKGVVGLTEARWLRLHINAKIYQFGRLQFEPDGSVIHVHIPEGEALLPVLCDESFSIADRFFGSNYKIYDCDSWLLSPELKKICSSDSNIIQFQNRFAIQKVTYPFLQAEERVFGKVLEDKSQYMEDTSLQRALKQYVIDGKEPGLGYGIITRNHL